MYQFTRSLTLQGPPAETMTWAVEITAHVNANSDLDLSLWTVNFGRPVGTLGWSAMVESRAALAAATQKLLSDGAYLAKVSEAADWVTTPGEDILRRLVHGEPPAEPPAIGSTAMTTTAQAIAGKGAEAIAWGSEIADIAARVGGGPVGFLLDAYGPFGQVAWIGLYADPAAEDAANDALMGSEEYWTAVGRADELMIQGSGHRTGATRIA